MARHKSLAQRLDFLQPGHSRLKIYNANSADELFCVIDRRPGQCLARSNVIDCRPDQYPARSESFLESTPSMRRIEVMDLEEDEAEDIIVEEPMEDALVCCMCMERKKRSELVPCKKILCRECARKLWFDRTTCPFCFRWIKKFLDLGF